ncbi:MAG TPA: TIGR03086 family metal-binding protein [Streptosporangiaceae bacterium]|jgi:uncharacterized protein (TIGR03086 family)|nr:TIGR03086 family metal-binding protein [Streptosporangiaceae bacterium]
MEPIDLGPAAQHLAILVTGVDDAQRGAPTPCPAYEVGDLLEHIGTLARAFAAAARKDRGPLTGQAPAGDAARLAADWRVSISRDLGTLAQAWSAPGAWEGTTRIAAMDSPADMVGVTLADELVVHGWDLAQATGQPFQPDPAAVRAARSFLDLFTSPDAPAGDEVAFGPSRPTSPGASDLDQVLALAGRDPAWAPVNSR